MQLFGLFSALLLATTVAPTPTPSQKLTREEAHAIASKTAVERHKQRAKSRADFILEDDGSCSTFSKKGGNAIKSQPKKRSAKSTLAKRTLTTIDVTYTFVRQTQDLTRVANLFATANEILQNTLSVQISQKNVEQWLYNLPESCTAAFDTPPELSDCQPECLEDLVWEERLYRFGPTDMYTKVDEFVLLDIPSNASPRGLSSFSWNTYYFPTEQIDYEGIIINSYLPEEDMGRALAHEIGHMMGLNHVFSSQGYCYPDGFPETKHWDRHCPFPPVEKCDTATNKMLDPRPPSGCANYACGAAVYAGCFSNVPAPILADTRNMMGNSFASCSARSDINVVSKQADEGWCIARDRKQDYSPPYSYYC